jgi:MFS family permease
MTDATVTVTGHGDRYRWVVLVIGFLTTVIGIMTFAAPFSLLNLWVRDLGISRTQIGFFTGLWYGTSFVVAFPAGWLADRVSLRRLLLGLWALNIVGALLMATATGFVMLCAGRVIFSIGTTGHVVAAPKLLATWFNGRKEYGLIIGVYSMSMTVGVWASLVVLGTIGEQSGWRPAMSLLVLLAGCGFLMMLLLPQQPVSMTAEQASSGGLPLDVGLAAVVLALAYGGYNVATEAYLTISPDYLVMMRGYGLATASAIVGSYALVALILKPILSSFLRRTNGVLYILAASAIFVVSVVLLLTGHFPPRVSAGVFGISMALAMPAFYALPALMFGTAKSGQVYGLYEAFYGLGFFAQPVIGWTIDRTGQYTAGYGVICCVAGLSLFGALWLIRPAPGGVPASAE